MIANADLGAKELIDKGRLSSSQFPFVYLPNSVFQSSKATVAHLLSLPQVHWEGRKMQTSAQILGIYFQASSPQTFTEIKHSYLRLLPLRFLSHITWGKCYMRQESTSRPGALGSCYICRGTERTGGSLGESWSHVDACLRIGGGVNIVLSLSQIIWNFNQINASGSCPRSPLQTCKHSPDCVVLRSLVAGGGVKAGALILIQDQF